MPHNHYSRIYRYLGIGGASIALVASFMLLLTHDQNKCSFTVNGSSRSKCQEDLAPICPSPAVDVKITSNTGLQYDILCAWGTATLAVSITSFLLSAIFILLHSFKLRKMKAMKFVLGTGVLALASLGVSFVMMFVDIIKGNDTIANDYSKFQGDKDFRQWAFVINLLLVAASFVAILSLEMHNYKAHYQRQKKDFLSPEDHEIEEFYFG